MSKPAEGAACTFYPSTHDTTRSGPQRGKVVKVWSDSCVNLELLDGSVVTSVYVLTEGMRPDGYYCVLDTAADQVPPGAMLQPKITGYRQLTGFEAALMNRVKAAGADLAQLLHEVNDHLAQQAGQAQRGDEVLRRQHQAAEPQRWLAVARTELQSGLMKLTRAVAQPSNF